MAQRLLSVGASGFGFLCVLTFSFVPVLSLLAFPTTLATVIEAAVVVVVVVRNKEKCSAYNVKLPSRSGRPEIVSAFRKREKGSLSVQCVRPR